MKKSSRSGNIEKAIEQAVKAEYASHIDRVTHRECSSEKFDGVQIDIYGNFVPVRPVISTIAEIDNCAIESFDMIDESGEEARLCIFVAYLPEQPHPAFI